MHWAAKYVGVPYVPAGDTIAGADCWGFVRLILRAERGLVMPALSVGQRGNDVALRRCFAGWGAVDLRKLRPFDIVTMRNVYGHHVGIVADANVWGALLIHCDRPQSSVIRYSMLPQFGYRDFRAWRFYGRN